MRTNTDSIRTDTYCPVRPVLSRAQLSRVQLSRAQLTWPPMTSHGLASAHVTSRGLQWLPWPPVRSRELQKLPVVSRCLPSLPVASRRLPWHSVAPVSSCEFPLASEASKGNPWAPKSARAGRSLKSDQNDTFSTVFLNGCSLHFRSLQGHPLGTQKRPSRPEPQKLSKRYVFDCFSQWLRFPLQALKAEVPDAL